jgi:hypothetical protein
MGNPAASRRRWIPTIKSLYIVLKKNGTSYKNSAKKMKKKRKSLKMWYYNHITYTKRGKKMGKEVIEEIEERPDGSKKIVKRSVEKGISFGSALAMVISFATWKSVGWAIIHGLFGWVYVVYFLIRYR